MDINQIDKFDARGFDFASLKVNNIENQKKLAEEQFTKLDQVLALKERARSV